MMASYRATLFRLESFIKGNPVVFPSGRLATPSMGYGVAGIIQRKYLNMPVPEAA
jgi:hypothetical protein